MLLPKARLWQAGFLWGVYLSFWKKKGFPPDPPSKEKLFSGLSHFFIRLIQLVRCRQVWSRQVLRIPNDNLAIGIA